MVTLPSCITSRRSSVSERLHFRPWDGRLLEKCVWAVFRDHPIEYVVCLLELTRAHRRLAFAFQLGAGLLLLTPGSEQEDDAQGYSMDASSGHATSLAL